MTQTSVRLSWSATLTRLFAGLLVILCLGTVDAAAQAATSHLSRFLPKVDASSLFEGADSFGPIDPRLPVAPVLSGGKTVAYAFITSDFAGTTGYSGKPIHIMVAIGTDAVLKGVKLLKHSEPIVLVGIPEAKIVALIDGYKGVDIAQEVASGGESHDLNIISGATVTVMVIDDSVIRSSIKVARGLGLGGLAEESMASGPKAEINPEAVAADDWLTQVGDGTVRRLSLDVGQINSAFAELPDQRAAERPEPGAAEEVFIDLYASLASIPSIGEKLLEPGDYTNMQDWLKPGDQAILVAGRGRYSFKGSGYVRGGIFDRIQLIQGDVSVRFRDKDHMRVGGIAAEGAPDLSERELFRIPADSGFNPAEPFRLQLLVQRNVGAIEKLFLTFDLGWQPPARFLKVVPAAVSTDMAAAPLMADGDEAEAAAKAQLWKRIWQDKTFEISAVAIMLAVLTAAFFFQGFLTRSATLTLWFRMGYLTLTLVFLGWFANAQLSVVNLFALAASLKSGFTWEAFLLDPLTFILWFSVAAALIFWGRGAYCGWLCPFGALQELTNRIARVFRVPQITLPWGLHERLWAVKYIIFLGLFGVSLASIEQAEHLAEIEPFKTAIILKFARAWPFLLYVGTLLVIGLFVERFYCRYLCPLGAALAIPARIRMFDWLKRYHECGNPCHTCANDCPVQAIHPTGEINPNECVNCMNCQVLYQSKTRCPVVMRKLKRRAAAGTGERPAQPAGSMPS
ncbi:NosR/NirI family protein [Roseibium suaedae]|uniref:NosR/NirI family transcriptional regulator, nitrous oxide reductase regulator n=1 Tax=Roseibium suaedae TaxID=735517 RepID=A0A1M7NWP8_9HYPH|nr:NosR/NirI family protein [Roseibium suaedae]SHN08551.1 NosR/NirI family transcriptional regulator, nitrous oxide reductase regulator [Roseibium suaedae]